MGLSKDFEMFLAQAKVAFKADFDLGSNLLVSQSHAEAAEKDPTLTPSPVWRDPMVKLEPNITNKELLVIVNYNSYC